MENTLLILGAGFSMPYGYPSGRTLVNGIIQRFSKQKEAFLSDFVEDLESYQDVSIDRFLAKNETHLSTGIRLIVLEMLRVEQETLQHKIEVAEDNDVMKIILNQLPEANFSSLRVISFNYDRFFEWSFLRRLNTVLRSQPSENYQKFKEIEIEHVHGRLPDCTDLEFSNRESIPYGFKNLTTEDINAYLDNAFAYPPKLHTIYSNSPDPSAQTIESIKWAKRIFFLGFAFDDMNMRKLGIGVDGIQYAWKAKNIAATCLALPATEKKRVQRKYPFLDGRLFEVTAAQLLREHFSLVSKEDDVEADSATSEWDCCHITAYQYPPNDINHYSYHYSGFPITCKVCKLEKMFTYTIDSEGKKIPALRSKSHVNFR